MLPRDRRTFFSRIQQLAWLLGVVLLLPISVLAEPAHSNVVCRPEFSQPRREDLASKLQSITGWSDLRFDRAGSLRRGNAPAVGGSKSARDLIDKAIYGSNVVVLEDASKSADVAFCRLIPALWKNNSSNKPQAHIVQIDFADFEQVLGDERALQAFNVGWGLLHEFEHVVNNSADAVSPGETGECEAQINQMRRECNLPERTNYFYTPLPIARDPLFATRLVRLAFDQEVPTAIKRKRYWIVWDANRVGGPEIQRQVAALR